MWQRSGKMLVGSARSSTPAGVMELALWPASLLCPALLRMPTATMPLQTWPHRGQTAFLYMASP